jgi:small subunit ribosomal protein S20
VAHHKSAIKRHRQSVKRQARNKSAKSAVRTATKKARAVTAADPVEAGNVVKDAQRLLAKAAIKGVFHKRTVARRISRLALWYNKLLKEPVPQAASTEKAKGKGKGRAAKNARKK